MPELTTDNYRKHTSTTSVKHLKFFQRFLIDNYYKVLIAELQQLSRFDSVLDAGCGEGFTLNRLQEAHIGKKVEGVDFLDRAINLGRKQYPKLLLKQANIYKLPYKDNSFDLVICSEVLEHLEKPDEAMKEIVRVSKKYLAISVPNEPLFMLGNFLRGKNLKRWGNDIEHINHWSSVKFSQFVSNYVTVLKRETPLPWTLIIAEKSN